MSRRFVRVLVFPMSRVYWVSGPTVTSIYSRQLLRILWSRYTDTSVGHLYSALDHKRNISYMAARVHWPIYCSLGSPTLFQHTFRHFCVTQVFLCLCNISQINYVLCIKENMVVVHTLCRVFYPSNVKGFENAVKRTRMYRDALDTQFDALNTDVSTWLLLNASRISFRKRD